jgi:hypothetical protein
MAQARGLRVVSNLAPVAQVVVVSTGSIMRVRDVAWTFFKAMLICAAVVVVSNIVNVFLIDLLATRFGVEFPQNDMPGRRLEAVKALSPWLVLYLGAVQAPLLEELTFRLWLKFRPWFVTVAVVSGTLLFMLLAQPAFWLWQLEAAAVIKPFVIAVVAGVVVHVLAKRYASQLSAFIGRHVWGLWLVQGVVFGMLHFSGAGAGIAGWVLVWPVMATGLAFGFVRLRYGFGHGLAAHVLINLVSILALLRGADAVLVGI